MNIKFYPVPMESGFSLLPMNQLQKSVDVIAHTKQITQEYIEYGLGFKTKIPTGWEGIIRSHKSICNYDLIMCDSPSIINCDYEEEWVVRFKTIPNNKHLRTNSHSFKTFISNADINSYEVGDIIAQITFNQLPEITFTHIDSDDENPQPETSV